jgi:Predicted nucleotide-binding protein containing TIR-like domain
MNKPRIFLGSSGKQAKLLQAITRGLEDVADVEPWTTTFNPGRSTLDRLVELSQEVDFAAFVFAQDDWTTTDASQSGQASPRDNVVFEAGLFGGALGMRRTFILHANDSKLPSDLLGLTSVRYDPATSPAEVRAINQKLRKAIETEGRRGPVEGLWWQLSLTMRTEEEPSAVSLLRISRDRDGALTVNGRGWQEDGTLSARYWSEAAKERRDPAGIFYFWKGERPRDPNAPQLEGTGEITRTSVDDGGGGNPTRARLPPTVDWEIRLSLSRDPRANPFIAAPGHETSPLLAGEVAPGHAAGLVSPSAHGDRPAVRGTVGVDGEQVAAPRRVSDAAPGALTAREVVAELLEGGSHPDLRVTAGAAGRREHLAVRRECDCAYRSLGDKSRVTEPRARLRIPKVDNAGPGAARERSVGGERNSRNADRACLRTNRPFSLARVCIDHEHAPVFGGDRDRRAVPRHGDRVSVRVQVHRLAADEPAVAPDRKLPFAGWRSAVLGIRAVPGVDGGNHAASRRGRYRAQLPLVRQSV